MSKAKMKLWLLQRLDARFGYDETQGFVVVAETEDEARKIAQKNGGDETAWDSPFWTDSEMTTCRELRAEHFPEAKIILRDFSAG